MSIGGTLVVHDPIRFDYCFLQAIESLLGVCDEVVVLSADCTDGTDDVLNAWGATEKRLRVVRFPWAPVRGTHGAWLADLGNQARAHLTTTYHVSLQADEVLHPDDYAEIRSCADDMVPMRCVRLNFWMDAKTIAASGHLCGTNIVRGGPVDLPLVGDAEGLMDINVARATNVRIYHVGFIRRPKAFVAKAVAMEEAFFGTHNPLLDRMEIEGELVLKDWVPRDARLSFEGNYPPNLVPWLKERGRL